MAQPKVLEEITLLKTDKLNKSEHSWNSLLNKPASLPANGGNSDTVDGLHATQLARQYVAVNSANISDTNAKEFYGTCVTANASAPNTDWWHIINVPHQDNNGYGAQLALGYHGQPSLMVRSALGTSWGAWYDVVGNIEALKTSGLSGPTRLTASDDVKHTFTNNKYFAITGSGGYGYYAQKIGEIDLNYVKVGSVRVKVYFNDGLIAKNGYFNLGVAFYYELEALDAEHNVAIGDAVYSSGLFSTSGIPDQGRWIEATKKSMGKLTINGLSTTEQSFNGVSFSGDIENINGAGRLGIYMHIAAHSGYGDPANIAGSINRTDICYY